MISHRNPQGPNRLTQREAEMRAAQITDVRYTLSLSLSKGGGEYTGDLTIEFRHAAPREGTFFDCTGQSIDRIDVNGEELASALWESNRLVLDGTLLREQNTVRIRYTNTFDRTGAGFHYFADPVDGQEYVYTNFEPYEAHRLLPCFDQPDIRAQLRLSVTAPPEWTVIANSRETETTTEVGGRLRHAYAETPPIATYLFAVIAGPYERFASHWEGVPLNFYARQSLKPHIDSDELFEVTRQGLAYFSEFFDFPYPFDKYDQIFVPEFNAGAMENVGAITFSERMVFRDPPTDLQRLNRAEVILHEMAHMWFGDLVTMRWWNDLWLNESFATYMAYLAMHSATRFRERAWQAFHSRMKAWAYHQDQLVTTHPIAGAVPDTDATFLNFDGITYGKGAAVLKQLAATIGMDGFRAGMRHYFETYAWKNTTLRQFLGALEHGASRDLGEWSRLWIETEGLNTIEASWQANGEVSALAVEQRAESDHPTLRPHALHLALIAEVDDEPVIRDALPAQIDGPRTVIEEAIGRPAPVCVFPNYDDHAYVKTILDAQSRDYVRKRIERFRDPLLRQQLWRALWDMVRDQQFRSTDYLALVRDKIVFEEELELIDTVLGNAQAAIAWFVQESQRIVEADALFEVAHERLFAAPDQNRRIAWARAAIATAQQPATVSRMLELIDRGTGISGFELDQDMRWSLAVKQVAYGIPGGQERVARESERDPSDRGQRAVARAATAAPDADGKARAWRQFIRDRDASLHMVSAAMDGFLWAHQADLLEPYVERFLDEVPGIFQSRDKDFANRYFGALFPYYRPDDTVIARTTALLGMLDDADPSLQRKLLEALDDLKRAHACRAFAAG